MFDIGWQELFIVAVLAILVVGPRDLPRTLRTVMGYIRKAKGMARDFQNGIDEVAREVELDDIRKEANKIAHVDLEKEVKDAVDPEGSLDKDLDMSGVQNAIQESANAMNSEPEIPEPVETKETSTKTDTPPSEEADTTTPATSDTPSKANG